MVADPPQHDENLFGWFLLTAWAMGAVLVFMLALGEGWKAFTPFLIVRVILGGVFLTPITAVLLFLVLVMSKG